MRELKERGKYLKRTDIIDNAIRKHGVKKVYEAAYKRMEGDKRPLCEVELEAKGMADVWQIMQRAFASLYENRRDLIMEKEALKIVQERNCLTPQQEK